MDGSPGKVLDAVKDNLHGLEGCRILLTGAAGTGESAVLKKICMITKDSRFLPLPLRRRMLQL